LVRSAGFFLSSVSTEGWGGCVLGVFSLLGLVGSFSLFRSLSIETRCTSSSPGVSCLPPRFGESASTDHDLHFLTKIFSPPWHSARHHESCDLLSEPAEHYFDLKKLC